jgi:Putative Flp pilus-assembly TadE/G-like
MRRLRNERGQAVVVTIVFLTVLLGLAAAVLDVGAWFRQHRQLQATADASALAGAQALPEDPGEANALALDYAGKNGGGVSSSGISLPSADTISVTAEKPAEGIFSSLFGIDSLDIDARAKARAGTPAKARWAAPIVVDEKHPLISGEGCPCFDEDTELDFEKVGPGAFRLVNLDDTRGGVGPADLAVWINTGFDGYMPLQWYYSDPGFKPSSSHVKESLTNRFGSELLFPIYRGTREQGAGFEYEVIGWIGFLLKDYDIRGSNTGKLYGSFTRVIWEGILGESASGEDFGVKTIELVE